MNKSESAQHSSIFAETQPNIWKWLRRRVRREARSRLCSMHDEARATRKQRHNYGERGTWMAEHLNRDQGAADRANESMHGIPGGVEPWNFIGEKFQRIENASNSDDPGIPEDLERLILRCESDPLEMDGKSGNENSEIKVDARQARQS